MTKNCTQGWWLASLSLGLLIKKKERKKTKRKKEKKEPKKRKKEKIKKERKKNSLFY
jgi:hypothetical protein